MLELSKTEGEDLLHLACKNGQVTLIKSLLKANVDVNVLSSEGLSPLHWAVIKGNLEVTKLLIREGANIEIKDSKNASSPLLFACQNGRRKIVNFLLEMRANSNVMCAEGLSPLHWAVIKGNLEVTLLLKIYGANIEIKDSKWGSSPFLYACQNARTKIVNFLFEVGGVIKAANIDGTTAIHFATQSGNIELVNFLLQKGLDINSKNNKGESPLFYMLYPRLFPVYLEAKHAFEMAKFLIENGARIDDDSLYGTPLTNAITIGNLDVVKLLILHGANVNHVLYNLSMPLLYAVNSNCNVEIIKFLIKSGADVNAAHKSSRITPLHLAANHFCKNKTCDIERVLFESGANPKFRNVNELTPLDFALERNQQFVKIALEFYPNLIAELNATRNFPIQYALQQNNHSTFKMITTHCLS